MFEKKYGKKEMIIAVTVLNEEGSYKYKADTEAEAKATATKIIEHGFSTNPLSNGYIKIFPKHKIEFVEIYPKDLVI